VCGEVGRGGGVGGGDATLNLWDPKKTRKYELAMHQKETHSSPSPSDLT
jgi:hypothetical protein